MTNNNPRLHPHSLKILCYGKLGHSSGGSSLEVLIYWDRYNHEIGYHFMRTRFGSFTSTGIYQLYFFKIFFTNLWKSTGTIPPPHSDIKIPLKKKLVGDDQFQYFSRFKDLPFLPFIRKIHWPKLNVLGRCGAVPDDYFGKILRLS